MNKFLSFAGKSVIVTGSSSGIGRATAAVIAKHDGQVVLTGRREEELKNTKNQCVQHGAKFDNIVHIKADVSTESGIQSIIDKAVSSFGGIDVLVNIVGKGIVCDVENTTMQQLDDLFNLNVKSTYRLSQLAIPYLKKSQGCIINMSSVLGEHTSSGVSAYSMTKAAINIFTETLALELAPYKVRVNAVCPGYIKTPIHQAFLQVNDSEMKKFYDTMGARHPLLRCGEAQEVADVITFLASDAASYITGAKIPVDGGMGITSSLYEIPVNEKTSK